MKGLSLTQPWATLCMLPARGLVGKHFETRSWSIPYRGSLAIHAAKGFPAFARNLCETEPFRSRLAAAGITSADQLPLGVILGTVQLLGCWRIDLLSRTPDPETSEWFFGDFKTGRYVWEFENPVEFSVPVPYRGRLGLFEVNL